MNTVLLNEYTRYCINRLKGENNYNKSVFIPLKSDTWSELYPTTCP